jgi:mediator of RNA polymerase II transcription subunit 17, fungi type
MSWSSWSKLGDEASCQPCLCLSIYNSIAAGELSQALDVVNLILSVSHPEAPSPHQVLPTASLGATFVTPPEEKPSINALNAQLIVGTKDRALRNASNILSRAAETVGTFVERGEVHWGQAILIRRANWGLLPKPLQPGSLPIPQHKDVDHSSRDFVISFGLEDCA